LVKAIKGLKGTKSYKVKKLLEHESVVMPKRSEVWALRHNQTVQSLLENKEVREMMRTIKNDPESIKKYLKVCFVLNFSLFCVKKKVKFFFVLICVVGCEGYKETTVVTHNHELSRSQVRITTCER
jgi:hypothetical protein